MHILSRVAGDTLRAVDLSQLVALHTMKYSGLIVTARLWFPLLSDARHTIRAVEFEITAALCRD